MKAKIFIRVCFYTIRFLLSMNVQYDYMSPYYENTLVGKLF